MGQGGEIFVLDMGEPVHILDLAKRMIELSEYRQSGEIDIVFTGASAGGEAVRGAAVLGGVDRQDAAPEDREDRGGAGFGAGGGFVAAAGAGFGSDELRSGRARKNPRGTSPDSDLPCPTAGLPSVAMSADQRTWRWGRDGVDGLVKNRALIC
jgi:hypothetical protein